jgi:hypothetical protein
MTIKIPELSNASSKYGAAMGRVNTHDEWSKGNAARSRSLTFAVDRLQWVDGDYDEGGAYWGHTEGEYIFRLWSPGHENAIELFIRAKALDTVKLKLRELYPLASVQEDYAASPVHTSVRAESGSTVHDVTR